MADTKISALPASTVPLAGTEVLPIVQSSATKQVSVANLTAGRAISATSVTASTGNFVVGTSGQGVDFSATPGAGTSELLADYEEGTWTPDVIGNTTAGTTTYTTRLGWYTKIGRQVTVVAVLDIANMTGTGLIKIDGLPYTTSSLSGFAATGSIISNNLDWPLLGTAISMYIPGNNAYAFIFAVGDNIAWAGVPVEPTWEAIITMTYFV